MIVRIIRGHQGATDVDAVSILPGFCETQGPAHQGTEHESFCLGWNSRIDNDVILSNYIEDRVTPELHVLQHMDTCLSVAVYVHNTNYYIKSVFLWLKDTIKT